MNESNLIEEKFSIKLKFSYSFLFFIIDQIIRLFIFFTYLYYGYSVWMFLLFQLFPFFIFGYINDKIKLRVLKKYSNYINPIYVKLNPNIEIIDNIPNKLLGYQMLFGYVFSFWFFHHIFENHHWYIYIIIIVLSFFGLIPFVGVLFTTSFYKIAKGAQEVKLFKNKKIIENSLEKIVDEEITSFYKNLFLKGVVVEPDPIEFDNVDLNDTKIAKLESELKNINFKTDAWLLESVFLGGLAFSGFLTVASANFLGSEVETFKLFILHINNYIDNCKVDNISSLYGKSFNSFSRNDLYILIMLLCLLSSVFFLLILTLRLRLNSLALNLDHIMRILIIFNAKEEEIFNNSENLENKPNQVARFEKIQRKIEIALNDAEKLLIKIRPIFIMMNIYRTIAILLFYLVLILSGFYFTPLIAVAITGLAFFTFLFRKIETYISVDEIRRRVKRH